MPTVILLVMAELEFEFRSAYSRLLHPRLAPRGVSESGEQGWTAICRRPVPAERRVSGHGTPARQASPRSSRGGESSAGRGMRCPRSREGTPQGSGRGSWDPDGRARRGPVPTPGQTSLTAVGTHGQVWAHLWSGKCHCGFGATTDGRAGLSGGGTPDQAWVNFLRVCCPAGSFPPTSPF